jgi:hypothetical protein
LISFLSILRSRSALMHVSCRTYTAKSDVTAHEQFALIRMPKLICRRGPDPCELPSAACNSHDFKGAICSRWWHAWRYRSVTKVQPQTSQLQCVDLPASAIALGAKFRIGQKSETHQPPPPVRKRRMNRSCSERMWLVFFPSIESSDASLIKTDSWRIVSIVSARCQRKSPASGALSPGPGALPPRERRDKASDSSSRRRVALRRYD